MDGNNQNVCGVCGSGNGRCGKCGNMCGFNGNHILRWVLGIIIITWIFSIGMRIGELKASLNSSYGYGYHTRMMPMMGGAQWGEGNVTFTTSAVPAVQSGTIQVIKK